MKASHFSEKTHLTVISADVIFGPYIVISLVVNLVEYFSGHTSLRGPAALFLFVLVNVVISQISLRVKNRIYVEVLRSVLGAFAAPLCYLWVEGTMAPWWSGYLIMCLGPAIFFGFHTGKPLISVIFAAWYTLDFAVTSSLSGNPDWKSETAKTGLILTMLSLLVAQILSVLGKAVTEIKEKGRAIADINEEMGSILNNIEYGILVFGENQKLGSNLSKATAAVLGEDVRDLENRDISSLFETSMEISKDDLSSVSSALLASFGTQREFYGLNSGHFPKELNGKGRLDGRIFEFDWVPIYSSADTLERMMIIIRDVTLSRKLTAAFNEEKAKLEYLSVLLQHDPEKVETFLKSTGEYLASVKDCIKKGIQDKEAKTLLMRNLHTIKGNSRMFGLKQLSSTCHAAETEIVQLESGSGSQGSFGRLDAVEKEFSSIQATIRQVHGSNSGTIQRLKSSLLSIENLVELFQTGKRDVTQLIQGIEQSLAILKFESFQDVLQSVTASVKLLCRELDLKDPKFVLEMDNVVADRARSTKIVSILIQLMRNSLDHGLRSVDVGTIHLGCASSKDHRPVLLYGDSGRGLNLKKIEEIAVRNKKLPPGSTDQQIAESIFLSGLSTSQNVTQLSGRGVGMDIVEKLVQEMGGTIEIEFLTAKDQDGYRKFQFRIDLGKSLSFCGPAVETAKLKAS